MATIVGSPWFTLEPYPRLPVVRFLQAAAERHPGRPALISLDGNHLTFGQAWSMVQRCITHLQRAGIQRGDCVGLLAPSSPEALTLAWGVMGSGAVAVPMNPLYKEGELIRHLQDADCRALFVAGALRPLVEAARSAVPSLRHVWEVERMPEEMAGLPEAHVPPDLDPAEDVAALPYSSGTTGFPKGVMLTHSNLVANIRQCMAAGILAPTRPLLNYMPPFHVYGFVALMGMSFAAGVPQVVIPRFDPELILNLVAEHRVAVLYTVPPALMALLEAARQRKRDLSSLRLIVTGAAPTPEEIARRAESEFNACVCQPYGLSEATAATNINPWTLSKHASVGPPIPDTEEKVVDLETGEELPRGEVGELLVRGPQVMKGYWRNAEATAATLTEDGWLRTGDIARHDEDGYLYIVDRKKEMIRYKGHQIAPSELEALLAEHPSVRDAAVVPKPDLEAGEIPKAYIVLRQDQPASEREIMDWVAERVNPLKRIRAVEFVEGIPRTPSGKILRRELIERERRGG